jgi:hypothetical protein
VPENVSKKDGYPSAMNAGIVQRGAKLPDWVPVAAGVDLYP